MDQDFIASNFERLESEVSARVPEGLLRWGLDRYGNWANQDYRWYRDDYDHCGFRAIYFDRLFETRARLVSEVLEYCDSEGLLPNFLGTSLNVVSFGCGPGCDLLGFQDFYQQKKRKRIAELKQRATRQKASLRRNPRFRNSIRCNECLIEDIHKAKVTYRGYDSSFGWEEYVHTLGFTFEKQWINKRFVESMPPVDIAILSYFSHSANLHRPTYINSSFWTSLTRKCKVVLVLDTLFESEDFDSMLSEVGFHELDREFDDSNKRAVYTTLWSKLLLW